MKSSRNLKRSSGIINCFVGQTSISVSEKGTALVYKETEFHFSSLDTFFAATITSKYSLSNTANQVLMVRMPRLVG